MPKRRWAFMPNVPNYGQSDGYHMHNIVVSHGVSYVYVWVFWRWVLFDGLWRIAMLYDTLFVMVFVLNIKWIYVMISWWVSDEYNMTVKRWYELWRWSLCFISIWLWWLCDGIKVLILCTKWWFLKYVRFWYLLTYSY